MGRLLDWKRLVSNLDWHLQGAGCTSPIENTSPNAVGQAVAVLDTFRKFYFNRTECPGLLQMTSCPPSEYLDAELSLTCFILQMTVLNTYSRHCVKDEEWH